MAIPQYAWLQIHPSQSWKIILPSKTNTKKFDHAIYPIAVGSHNQIKNIATTSYKISPAKLTYTYPIRLIKKDKGYKAGPFVGILTTKGTQGFKGNVKNFIDIIQMGKKAGVFIFVFPAEEVDLIDQTVKAYIYDSNQKKWVTQILPFPDVVYNRIPSRKEENKPSVKAVLEYLVKENIPFFNPYFFNKWALHQWMSENKEMTKILPDTTILKEEDLRRYLQQYTMLYLKPVNGKAGIGFMKIEKKENHFYLTYQTRQMTYHQSFRNFQSLWQKVHSLAKNKKYIIQQGIFLNTYQQQPYDLRVLVQKNGKNQWKVTGIGVRVAGEQSITTHVPQGGYIQSVDQVFKETFKDDQQSNEWKEKTTMLAVKIAEHIESKIKHPLGEMSMDLGIDKNGNLWFFEANAKPMEFDEPNIRETSLLRLIQYFRYLSGFVPKGGKV
ncbi:YheC/YheD family protein [Tepidibacillus fermentans]|uniref:YheC/D-like protein n=1 Tax=Tepidibacillus fermentans TaxID=1281767 RepID=A0A4R3KK71_9BACI|nr:YheC/YheD family protein [Tepidibacillus fermentans]TCS83598.1 YheC/D-like protein [Tepidibacillus fermentans]